MSASDKQLPYSIRLSREQRAAYQKAADAAGRTLANWIKWTCDNAARVKP